MLNQKSSSSPAAKTRPPLFELLKDSMDSAETMNLQSLCPSPRSNTIRWRKGELIGAGAFGSVYMGMNLDSGELLAVKQVLVAAKNVTREKSQAHLKELEDEVKLLQNLSHPHIVRYLGTAREDGALNIFLEFVPGGSIASLLGKFGSFPESVIRMYSRQLLQGLEYLHKNGIMHRDIKGANILVDNKGVIKLADFGASKQVVELVTISGAKSMKGTPYWMAPEVIRQTGHSLPADIWSVGCTIIEMATGKAPWSQQFQEVAALFHIGTTKSHPPIPEHLSREAQDFLRKCLRKEPHLRSTASELLEHAFIRTDNASRPSQDTQGTDHSQIFQNCKKRPLSQNPVEEKSGIKRSQLVSRKSSMDQFNSLEFRSVKGDFSQESCDLDLNCFANLDCDSYVEKSFKSACHGPSKVSGWECQSIYNPVSEPSSSIPMHEFPDVDDGWCNLSSPELKENRRDENILVPTILSDSYRKDADFSFQCIPAENDGDDDEVTESKIKAFLHEKALELKRLQTPLYVEFKSFWNVGGRHTEKRGDIIMQEKADLIADSTKFVSESLLAAPSSSRSSSKKSCRSALSIACSRESEATVSSESPRLNELKRLLLETQQPLRSPSSLNSFERQRLWKEELQQELEIRREERKLLSQLAGTTRSSPARKILSQKERPVQNSPAKKFLPTLKTFLMPTTPEESTSVLSIK
ncbi:hypothetical protein GOP47_0018416 [Adiantum capillus-veneris]|uniref:mitogen-activated protein kinase kinase kinase n=1 Tax=Adiantum capillus-veneris TaxID=13818 RepID=A0A9D4UDL4_ADICA|nr:hypothetical protein GOP47_0018416 [Adiantum capillus-veneris]